MVLSQLASDWLVQHRISQKALTEVPAKRVKLAGFSYEGAWGIYSLLLLVLLLLEAIPSERLG